MNKWNELKTKSLFSPAVYKKGLKFIKERALTDLTYDVYHEVWTTKTLDPNEYFIEIKVENLQEGSFHSYCDCAFFATYHECEHVVACFIQIQKQLASHKKDELEHVFDINSKDIIQSLLELSHLQDHSNSILTKKALHVQYILQWTNDHHLYIHLKTGLTRKYIVRDIKQFLQSVFTNEEYEFTDQFSYRPNEHYFLEKDLKVFKKLQQFLLNEAVYNKTENALDDFKMPSKRFLTIPPLTSHYFLGKLTNRDLLVIDELNEYKKPLFVEEKSFPIDFFVELKEGNCLQLTWKRIETIHYFTDYNLLFISGVFYRLTEKQQTIYNQIIDWLINREKVLIANEDASLFLSVVVPSLKKIGNVHIEANLQKQVINTQLRGKLALNMENETIHGTLIYNYGHISIDPFTEEQQTHADDSFFVLRDIEKEKRIMDLIELVNFHYNGKTLFIVLQTEEDLYHFLKHTLLKLKEEVELDLSNDLQTYLNDLDKEPIVHIDLNESTQLLEIGFSIEGVDRKEVEEVLKAVVEKRKYHQLKDGSLISLETKQFANVANTFQQLEMEDSIKQKKNLSIGEAISLNNLLQTKKNYNHSFANLLQFLRNPEKRNFALPSGLQAELRPYQKRGYHWFKILSYYRLGGILADDMGLGKTLQTIAYLLSEQHKLPHLIVVPTSVVYNWKEEFKKFAPTMDVGIVSGTRKEREKLLMNLQNNQVWITSYATLRQDLSLYKNKAFHTLILDEAQYVKNYRSKTSKSVRQIQRERTFALTGTPIENSIEELWAIFQVVLPYLLPGEKTFKQLPYEQIHRMIQPFILRRLKEDVLEELPEKIESIERASLTKEQKKLYLGYWQQLQQKASDSFRKGKLQQDRMEILAGITRLRQICCHPSLFVENYEGQSGKLIQLLSTVDHLLSSGRRILLFSQFTSMHDIFQKELKRRNIDYFYLHGNMNQSKRLELCQRFNKGERNVFLISLKAGGTGLNLTGADTVILYDLWWNPAVEDQAAGRAHRFGQENVVQVIRFITEGTIEEKIFDLQIKKRKLIDSVIERNDEVLNRLSEKDLRMLLNIKE